MLERLRIIAFLSLVFIFYMSFLSSCKRKGEKQQELVKNEKELHGDFVKADSTGFSLKGEPFFPLILNYVVQFRAVKEKILLGSTLEYDQLNNFEYSSEEGINRQMNNHFGLIKKMGFNTVRIIGLDLFKYHEGQAFPMLEKVDSLNNRTYFSISEQKNVRQIISSINQLRILAEENDLKLILLLPRPLKDVKSNDLRLNLIKEVLNSQKTNSSVFAYDFFNEPLYFDNSEYFEFPDVQRLKKDAVYLVRSWSKLMDQFAPNQLMTISYAEPIEVFEWDPGLLELDFVSFHTYNPLRVPSEIYWFSKFAKKPWIITETSLPADNDSISYASQSVFMKEVLQKVVNCGGSGFGWWQFQDTDWGTFEHQYTALLNHDGYTLLENGDTIFGTIKPAVNELKNFEWKKNGLCNCPLNYYNMLGYQNFKLNGKVYDQTTKNPIEGALIRGWVKDWSIGVNTFTNEKGEFTLFSNEVLVHYNISSVGKETLIFSFNPDFGEVDFNALNQRKLEYHDIHYKHLLKKPNKSASVFNFDPAYFNRFQYEASMGVKFLGDYDQD